jgi:adenylyl-sulfate kinase
LLERRRLAIEPMRVGVALRGRPRSVGRAPPDLGRRQRAAPATERHHFDWRTDLITRRQKTGLVIWLTGLSGAGKSTLARSLSEKLLKAGHRVETLDGDEVRENLSRGLGFSKEDRDVNVRRIGFVARLLARNAVVVLVAAISPYRLSRDDVRRSVEDDGIRFIEAFVRCPIETLVERDVKGLYVKALAGEIANFTGISDPYEEPLFPDVVVDSSCESIEQSAEKILSLIPKSDHRVTELSRPEMAAPVQM